MTAADVAYVEANYLSFEEACAGRAEALEQVRAVAAAGQLPQPSYVLPDGTEMVPADYFEIADAGRDVFEREFLAAGGSPDEVDAEWDGYLSGAYGVCLKEQTPANIVRKEALVKAIGGLLASPEPGDERLALPPQDGGRRARRARAAVRAGLRPGPLGPELSRPLHHGAAGALSGGLRSSRRRIAFSQLLLIAPLPSRIRNQ